MSEHIKLDRIDINILAHLQRNGRITNVELAEAVALSPSPCLIRVKRLEKAGYIVGYNAHIDIAKLGETVTVFTQVTLSDHHMEDFARFESGIRTVDEVIECHLISGGYDYLLKFMTRGIAHYQKPHRGDPGAQHRHHQILQLHRDQVAHREDVLPLGEALRTAGAEVAGSGWFRRSGQ